MKQHLLLKDLCKMLFLISLIAPTAFASSGFVDGVVATVGREPILHSDVTQEMLPMLQSFKTGDTTPEEQEQLFKDMFNQALEQVIEYHILYLEAVAFKIEIPDDNVEKRMDEVRKQYGSNEAFQQALAGSGHTISDFRERLKRQMMALSVSRSKRNEFEKEVVVSESDIADYYQENLDAFQYPAQYKVRRIFVQAPSDADERASVKDTLIQMREKLVAGDDFAEAAKAHSAGPEAADGGMMGWVRSEDMVEPLNAALASLAVGEISPVLETEYGLHLLKLEEIKEAGSLSLADARKEIEPLVRRQQGEKRYRQWMDSLRRRNNVRILL
jgi:peptidyl-prolyl cis-trans isomerase C